MNAFLGRGIWSGDLLREEQREGGIGIAAKAAEDGKVEGNWKSGSGSPSTVGDGDDSYDDEGDGGESMYITAVSKVGHWWAGGTKGSWKEEGDRKS
jgi:hypothetical protein